MLGIPRLSYFRSWRHASSATPNLDSIVATPTTRRSSAPPASLSTTRSNATSAKATRSDSRAPTPDGRGPTSCEPPNGSATPRGPSSSEPRSSRSTSAAYARGWRKGDVSDDQTVDVIPVLPPRIKRSALGKAIAELETATADDYHSAITWLNRHKFYLNQEQCRRINAAIARIQKEPLEVAELRRVWKEFSPDPSLSDSYFESEDAEPASS